MQPRALVTGGAGFIGGHIARDLISRDYAVDIVDNLRTGDIRNVPKEASFLHLDASNTDIFRHLTDKYQLIYHFAGQSSVEISYRDPKYDFNSNLSSTVNILELARKSPGCHLLYASSMSVYGGDHQDPRSENSPLHGFNPYALSKSTSEKYLQLYQKYDVKSTPVRLFNIYGPGQNLSNLSQGMLSIYLAQALKDRTVLVKGPLDRTRDFVHIYDVLRFLRKLEHNSNAFGLPVNICSGHSSSVRSILDDIETILGVPISITVGAGTPGDIPHMLGCSKRLESITGIQTSISVAQGIKTMVDTLNSATYFK